MLQSGISCEQKSGIGGRALFLPPLKAVFVGEHVNSSPLKMPPNRNFLVDPDERIS